MKNTNRKDFHTRVEVGTVVTISYMGAERTFKNILHNNKTLWEMCEYVIGGELQSYWDYNLDVNDNNKYHREEERLMNLCKIVFH